MQLSRRFFVRAAGMSGLAAIVPAVLNSAAFGQNSTKPGAKTPPPPAPKPPASPSAPADPFATLSSSVFYQQIGSNFIFRRSTSSTFIDMKLIAVETLRPTEGAGGNAPLKECFALVFEGPARSRYRQSTFNVEHGTLGKFQIFVVPTGAMSRWGWTYVATINRIKP
ncbi:MAG TPA: hypothetical protein VJH03_13995 [Blastocatellia bacterium]|nr:hypothetical protein [Blastocatellia bacterium]